MKLALMYSEPSSPLGLMRARERLSTGTEQAHSANAPGEFQVSYREACPGNDSCPCCNAQQRQSNLLPEALDSTVPATVGQA